MIHFHCILDETFEDGVEEDPDYSGGIEKAFEDYEKFYDDYEDSHVSAASSLEGRCIWVIFMLACWVITGLFSWNTEGRLTS